MDYETFQVKEFGGGKLTVFIDKEDAHLIADEEDWRIHPKGVLRLSDNSLLHRLITGARSDRKRMTFFKNGIKTDVRKENLKEMTVKYFNTYVKKPVYKEIVNGKPAGIRRTARTHKINGKKHTYYSWTARVGTVTKTFSINKYGEVGAAKMAIDFRINYLKETGRKLEPPIKEHDSWGSEIERRDFAMEKFREEKS